MVKKWKKYFTKQDESGYEYDFETNKKEYKEIKQLGIAAVVFVLMYCAHSSNTQLGLWVDKGIRHLVNDTIEAEAVVMLAKPYFVKFNEMNVLNRLQSVTTTAMNPLEYMSNPVNGEIAASFQGQGGIEYKVPIGTNVKSITMGQVIAVTENAEHGKMILLSHGENLESYYGFLSEILVKVGDRISQGQVIGKSGNKPKTLEARVYFELREKNLPIDPMVKLKKTL